MKISFLGGTETVTGSKYPLSFGDNKNILVDFGLFQGHNELRLLLLVKNGFTGPTQRLSLRGFR